MDAPRTRSQPRRNKGFDETHREMIETAVRLISEKGADSVSIAALAREMGINRTTVYYHFDSREALLHAVTSWAAQQLEKGMDINASQPERIGHISRFVLENPELIKLWIEGFVAGTDIRASYTRWDELVSSMAASFAAMGADVDAEVYCVMLLSSSIIGSRVYGNSVRPGESTDVIVGKFMKELQRTLTRDGLTGEF